MQNARITVGDMPRERAFQADVERVVEVAIGKRSIPSDVQMMAAHQALEGLWIEGSAQESPIVFGAMIPFELLDEATDGQIGERQETREPDPEAFCQLLSIGFFELQRIGRQRGPGRVEYEIETEALRDSVAERIETAKCSDVGLIGSQSTLAVYVFLEIAGK